MPSAQRDLSHLSPHAYVHIHTRSAATFTYDKHTLVRMYVCAPPVGAFGKQGHERILALCPLKLQAFRRCSPPPQSFHNTCVLLFNRGESGSIVEQGILAWPNFVVGFVTISIRAKKTQPELLIGSGLICNHRKGKERPLSCATAINNPQTCIINHQQELRASLLRWR